MSHITDDIQASSSEFDWAVSIFYLAYMIFVIPNIILLRISGPTLYLSVSMILWGTITLGIAFVKNATQLIVVRFLLGMTEAGFFPGIVIYLSFWYRKQEQIFRIAIFFSAAAMAGGIGSIMAYGISKIDGLCGLNDWQWIFLLEGLPIIPLGIITFLFLDSVPETVQWLNSVEKNLFLNYLRDDDNVSHIESMPYKRFSLIQLRHTFTNWQLYLYTLITTGISAIIKTFANYLPSLIQDMQLSKLEYHILTIPPYILAFISCLVVGYSSSRRKEHCVHLVLCLLVALVSFILMITMSEQTKVARYIGSCFAASGSFAALPIILSWLTNNVNGHTKRAMSVGFAMFLAQIGGIVAPQHYHVNDRPIYRRGHIISSVVIAITLLLVLTLRYFLARENNRRENLTHDMYKIEAAIEEPCDQHPGIRYVL
ncbi:unnamed protein product [Rotaria sordida]|uniref:Major facilitator superfamily (MFS) profile domain-containing protein n=1 Tax=Rotaria sordida TaxID=392033 RepID=A0A814P7J2_9BILA|nr:unnamed protein product [Rotaria sordida]